MIERERPNLVELTINSSTPEPRSSVEEIYNRVVILAPSGRDSSVINDLLTREQIPSQTVRTIEEICQSVQEGIGACVIADESINEQGALQLAATFKQQPKWSDVPLIVLTGSRDPLGRGVRGIAQMTTSCNMTLLERPVRMVTLLSAIQSALRGRMRQYEVRDLLMLRERELQRRDEFLAMLGHELRNPLAPIRNGLHILKRFDIFDDRVVKARDLMDRQIQHMSRIVDDLLDVSRVAKGKICLQKENLDLVDVIRHSIEDYRSSIEARHLKLDVKLPEYPVMVNGDRTRLAQVLGNLLHNASKFTQPGGQVSVALTGGAKQAQIVVADNGIGMSRETIVSLFEPFSQADSTLDRQKGGLGLGLVLVKKLIELHDGEVEAMSDGVGRGSRFIIRLPVQLSARVPEILPSKPIADGCRRILVIEDNLDALETMRIMLELCGHTVVTAENGPDGIAKARESHPHVILCDIGLPNGMDGYVVAKTLRADPRFRNLPLIALTGYGQIEDQRRALDAGFSLHLTKPVDPLLLEGLISGKPVGVAEENTAPAP